MTTLLVSSATMLATPRLMPNATAMPVTVFLPLKGILRQAKVCEAQCKSVGDNPPPVAAEAAEDVEDAEGERSRSALVCN